MWKTLYVRLNLDKEHMTLLDDQTQLEQLDTGKVVSSIRLLPDQMEQAWEEVKTLELPSEFKSVDNVVICGMGGSALGGRIIDSLIEDRVRVPIEVFNQYSLPHYVNSKTLVLVNTYSGTTEEAISMARQAVAKKTHVVGVATGGTLKDLFEKEGKPLYLIHPKANPSGQPRMGLGYSIAATIALLAKVGLVHMTDDEFYEIVVKVREFVIEFDFDIATSENVAKMLAGKFKDKALIFIASNHLVGVAHAMKNQVNESSKVFTALFELPELNHHLLEGLKYPTKLHGVLEFFMINSDLYHPRIQMRYPLTADIIKKNGHTVTEFTPRSSSKITQIFEVLTLGSFVSFYLAVLNGVDPTAIPYVDYFKEQLAKATPN